MKPKTKNKDSDILDSLSPIHSESVHKKKKSKRKIDISPERVLETSPKKKKKKKHRNDSVTEELDFDTSKDKDEISSSSLTSPTNVQKKQKKHKIRDEESGTKIIDESIYNSPSKKKKKIKVEDEEFSSHYFESSQDEISTPKQKKKKSKDKSRPSDIDDSPVAISPEKKKKKKNDQTDEDRGNTSEDLVARWTKRDVNAVVDYVLNMNKDTPKQFGYGTEVKKISWDKMSETLHEKDHVQCQEVFKAIMSRLCITKSMHQLMEEAKEMLGSDKEFNGINFQTTYAVKCFLNRHCKNNDISTLNEHYEEWKKLSKIERKEYVVATKMLNPQPTPYKQPYMIMKDILAQRGEITTTHPLKMRNYASQKYQKLPDEYKCKLIKKSINLLEKYEEQIEKYKIIDPDWTCTIKYPSKLDMSLYFSKMLKMPKDLTASVYEVYFEENEKSLHKEVESMSNLLRHNYMRKIFTSKPKEIRDEYTFKCNQVTAEFKKDLNTWISEQTPTVQRVYLKVFAKRKKSKSKPKDWIEQETTMNKVAFKHVPRKPPIKAFDVYYQKLIKNAELTKEDKIITTAKSEWITLSEKRKTTYQTKAEANKSIYKNDLLNYACAMTEDQLKLFLGFKRKLFCTWFGEDIFEADFPNVDYPVLIPLKTDKKIIDDSSGSDSESEQKPTPIVTKNEKGTTSPILFKDYDEAKYTPNASKPKQEASPPTSSGSDYSSDDDQEQEDQKNKDESILSNTNTSLNRSQELSFKEEVDAGDVFEYESEEDSVAPAWKSMNKTNASQTTSSDEDDSD